MNGLDFERIVLHGEDEDRTRLFVSREDTSPVVYSCSTEVLIQPYEVILGPETEG